jgi:hypothetical protein
MPPAWSRTTLEIGEENVREIALLYSYRIMYERIDGTIYIHGVFHRRRDFKPEDLQR